MAEGTAPSLARNAINLPAVVFQSVATMGPGVGLAYSIGVGALFAGGAEPLSVILALAACLFVAIAIGQLAKHMPSAGGPATYTARGLHPSVGFVVAWAYSFLYFLATAFLLLLVGYLFAGVAQSEFGWNYTASWIAATTVSGIGVFFLNYTGIRVNTAAGLIFGIFEMVIFAALSIFLIVKAGSHNTLAVLGTKYATVKGFRGLSGVFAGSVYAILAFIGFDAAAPLGEEARDPRRTIKYAVVGSALLVGVYYLFATYAAAVFFGPEKFGAFPGYNDSNPWVALARSAWGIGWVLVFITLLNSAQANTNGVANAATRVLWSMGRNGILPKAFASVSPKHRSPSVATLFTFVGGLALALVLGVKYTPTMAYAMLGTMIVGLVIPVYMLLCLASIVYYLREQRREFNVLTHLILPVLGIAVFVPPLLAGLGVTALGFSWIAPLAYPLNLATWVVVIWYALGIVLAGYFMARQPARLRQTAAIFEEDEPSAVVPA